MTNREFYITDLERLRAYERECLNGETLRNVVLREGDSAYQNYHNWLAQEHKID